MEMEKDLGRERIETGRRIIIFFGPEGSGKTENAKLLSVASGKLYLSTSKMLHDVADNDSGYLGKAVKKMFDKGVYLKGEPFLEILSKRLLEEDTINGCIADGCLRTVEETVGFEEMLIKVGRNFPLTVIYLKIPVEVSLERILTGEHARKRPGDTPEKLESRLADFNFRLDERLNIIKNNPNWNFIEIDATPPLATVFGKVCEAVSST
jgi:adenylate kinase family enzyme